MRNLGIKTEIYLSDKKLKTKMKYADKLQIPYVIVIGEDEIQNEKVKIKNMQTGEEISAEFNSNDIAEKLTNS